MKRLAIFGSKDLAKTIIENAVECGKYTIYGYFDNFEVKGKIIDNYEVKGNTIEDVIQQYEQNLFDCIYIAIGYNHFNAKEKIYNSIKGLIPLANIISNDTYISDSAVLGEGIFIGRGSKIGPRCLIEDNVHIGSAILGHDNTIGKHSYLSGSNAIAGFTTIGSKCFLGIGVLVSDHISICDDVWCGIGMVIMRRIKKPGKYALMQKIIQYE